MMEEKEQRKRVHGDTGTPPPLVLCSSNKKLKFDADIANTTERESSNLACQTIRTATNSNLKDFNKKEASLPLTPPLSPPKDTPNFERKLENSSYKLVAKPLTKIFFPSKGAKNIQGSKEMHHSTSRDNSDSFITPRVTVISATYAHATTPMTDSQISTARPMNVVVSRENENGPLLYDYEEFVPAVEPLSPNELSIQHSPANKNNGHLKCEEEPDNYSLHGAAKRKRIDGIYSSNHFQVVPCSTSIPSTGRYKGKNHDKCPTGKFARLVDPCISQPLSKIKTVSPRATMLRIEEFPSSASNEHYDASQLDDNTIVCRVNGLLNLPGSSETRYDITAGELRRRISEPEYLNKVDMISYVRLAKSSARDLLEKYDIRPKHHSRRSKHSVLSKMCEGECNTLAQGIKELNEQYFPTEWLSNKAVLKIVSCSKTNPRNIIDSNVKDIKTTISSLQNVSTLIAELAEEKQMVLFDQATHSFGVQNIQNLIHFLIACFNSQREVLKTYSSILD